MIKKSSKRKEVILNTEAEVIDLFKLNKVKPTLKMQEWLDTKCILNEHEEYIFNQIIEEAIDNVDSWNEEELKMYFISYIIGLSNLRSKNNIRSYFERIIEAEVDGFFLRMKPDFMIATGVMDLVKNPYFYFQEYKKDKNPNGDPLAQLLQDFLIAGVINNNDKPQYGTVVVGRYWYFVIMQNREYCVSPSFDSTKEHELIQIIAILRHFKVILETKLLVD
ncbi:MAG: hypothetical protein RL619_1884 [Bacteroidota bacterium]|jgi:hypothetical protein